MRRTLIVALLAWLTGAAASAEIIDRVLAVVNGSIITLSDVRAAQRLGLIAVPGGDRDAATLERLIERRLTLTEVNRYAPTEPGEALIEDRLRQVRGRFPSEQALAATLAEVGVTPEQLRAYLRDEQRIATYVQQRFVGAAQPSEAEILEYYRAHPETFSRNGLALTYSEAHDDARAAVIAERRARLVSDWVAGLRRRADITIPAIVKR